VIVVVIIGVVAAIAVPRLASGARGADESALIGSLSAMRRAIDIYSAEHQGDFPGKKNDGGSGGPNSAAAFLSQMTTYSNADGKVAAARDAEHPFGPYLRSMPGVPVGANKGSTTVVIDTANSPPLVVPGPAGWVYNPRTGEIIANCDDANADGTRAYDEY
jgi:type II secretory pathway pseudopilin PulG